VIPAVLGVTPEKRSVIEKFSVVLDFDSDQKVHYRLLYLSAVVVLAMLGMLSPASRGALMTAGIFVFMFMGLVAKEFTTASVKLLQF